jgi:hypothetical protein
MAKINTKNPDARNDEATADDAHKFICERKSFFIMIKDIVDGKQVRNIGHEGKETGLKFKPIHFTTVDTFRKDKDGNVYHYCILVTSKAIHGETDHKLILDNLRELKKNAFNKILTDEEFMKKRNPEAFEHAKDKAALADENEFLKARIAELENKTGLNLGPQSGPTVINRKN